ncbi:hypothetical protein V8E55_009528 [Tylopilus felleus]
MKQSQSQKTLTLFKVIFQWDSLNKWYDLTTKLAVEIVQAIKSLKGSLDCSSMRPVNNNAIAAHNDHWLTLTGPYGHAHHPQSYCIWVYITLRHKSSCKGNPLKQSKSLQYIEQQVMKFKWNIQAPKHWYNCSLTISNSLMKFQPKPAVLAAGD